ncbi:unnamed protein product, partial [Brugia timori]|uniref:Uncharacterized protein n=1 Tax=Brugia timori TaxID=42155 RepID=A0A0R3QZ20_9BILA
MRNLNRNHLCSPWFRYAVASSQNFSGRFVWHLIFFSEVCLP